MDEVFSGYLSVTAALITSAGRLFVAQRPPWKKFGLLWEFPGGKVEPGEELRDSLVREIKEELCLEVTTGDLFTTISHSEEGFAIQLHAFWCRVSGGRLCMKEHIAFKWAQPSDLRRIELTKADSLLIAPLERLGVLPEYPGALSLEL